MYQLVITGAMCSGKTTLLHSFGHNSLVSCIEDKARLYLQEHPQQNRKSLEVSQAIIREYVTATQTAAAKPGALVTLAEGSVLNPVAHLIAWGDEATAARLSDELRPTLQDITMFFLLDIDDVPYVRDAIRTESAAYRQQLQKTYKQLLEDLQLPYKSLSGAITIRRQRLESYLESLIAIPG